MLQQLPGSSRDACDGKSSENRPNQAGDPRLWHVERVKSAR